MKYPKISLFVILTLLFTALSFGQTKPKVTFIELGSVNCIPCKAMQPVMKVIEEKYGEQVKVIFYDVWTKEQRHYAERYKIKLIPTQVFLDENGKEFHRHEGFYPEAEIQKILQGKRLKPMIKKG
jgi:thioredoxin 1